MSQHLTITVQNATARLRTLRLEPWARHFIMTPDEKVEVIVPEGPGRPSFRLVEADNTTLLYTSGCDRLWIIQDGITQEILPVYAGATTPARAKPWGDDPMWDRDMDIRI